MGFLVFLVICRCIARSAAGGKAAALFARGDSESLAQQLMLLLEDEAHRQRYGVAARQLVEQHYSRRVAGQQYIHAFGL